MDFMLTMEIGEPDKKINYHHPVLLIGSCFTEHIGNRLDELKFEMLQNPNGILYDPQSMAGALVSYMQDKRYVASDLVHLNGLWQSWQHHSRFAAIDQEACLDSINQSQEKAHHFLRKAKWLIITLGTSFSYRLVENNLPVANCHKAPAQQFRKHAMSIDETIIALDNCLYQLFIFNPDIRVIFTVSPVRHIRDGVIANNRSKARLIEAVQQLSDKFERLYYFPAYELVIDILRDYRFYEADMVHPNAQATQFVFEKFFNHYVDDDSKQIAMELQSLLHARKHRAFQPASPAHRQFLQANLEKAKWLKEKYPFLSMDAEIEYFGGK